MSLNKKISLLILSTLIMILLSISVFAGTLVSGSTVTVTSNNDDISGKYTLVGLWSTNPNANDKIVISNAVLPAPYGIVSQLAIDVPQPTFEQVFAIGNQIPMFEYALFETSTYYLGSNEERAAKALAEFRKSSPTAIIQQRYELHGTWDVSYKEFIVFVVRQRGWVGTTTNKGINYAQQININGVGTMNLVRNEAKDQLVDSISGVALARLTGFSSWTNGLLDTRNTYAYHTNNDQKVGTWTPFNDGGTYYSAWTNAVSNLVNANPVETQKTNQQVLDLLNTVIANVNKQVDGLVAVSTNYPTDWSTKGYREQTRTSGNDVVVPLQRDALVANIQLILNGEKFGIFIPTGVPAIINYDSSITFDETSAGNVKYTVQNVGSADGSFRMQLFCNNKNIVGEADDLLIAKGQQTAGDIRVTGKSLTTADVTDTCKLQLLEVTTKKTVEVNVAVKILAKSNCAQGQQSAPYTSGGKTYVDTYDAKCNVIDTLACTTATQDTKIVNGLYKCVDKPVTPGTVPSTEPGDFNSTLFGISVLVGLIAVFFAYTPVKEFTFALGKPGKYIQWVVMVGLFLAVALWLVPMISKWFLGLFSI